MNTADKNDLKDQLNILFDDIDNIEKPAQEPVKAAPRIVAAEKSPEDTQDLSFIDLAVAEEAVTLRERNTKAAEEKTIDFGDFEELVLNTPEKKTVTGNVYEAPVSGSVPVSPEPAPKKADPLKGETFYLDGDDYEEDLSLNRAPLEADDFYVSPHREELRLEKRTDLPSPEEIRKESIRFWIFTAVIAVIVAASVIFILNRRGIIELGFLKKETTAPTTTTAAPTTTTTAPTTTTAAPTTTTAPTTETTTEEPATTTAGANSVLDNYDLSNLFVIKVETANVRQDPSTDAKIIATMNLNSGGEVIDRSGEWYHVRSGGIEGYVYQENVITGEEAQAIAVANARMRVKVTAIVNVRREANTESEDNVIETVNVGTVYDYIGEEGSFYHIYYNAGTEAYVSRDFSEAGYYLNEAVAYYEE